MSFRDLKIQVRYRSDENDIPKDFLIPVLEKSVIYKRSVGFFSTSALSNISIGLFAMAQNNGKVELICSPRLSEDDIEAINLGYKTRDEAFTEALQISIKSPIDYFEEERLNLVATMIASGMLDLKIAFMENENGISLYHEKLAIFEDEFGNRIGFTGSLNESENAFNDNFESVYTFCSWKDESQKDGVENIEQDFDRMWNDCTKKLCIIPFPKVIIERLKQFKKDKVDYDTDKKQFD